jgi:lysophospholipase L1-like esterase
MKFLAKYQIPLYTLFFLVVIEILLRVAFGLGNPVLLQVDADTGYRFRPNQIAFRFGKSIKYNQYSQRSQPINAHKPQAILRILMVGDSILNGANPTDQNEIISELFKANLMLKTRPVEVLNASAGSWGIGNELGYIRKFGTFESDAVILELSTHDLTQPTSTSQRLGNDPNYPTQKPILALQEVLSRYALPKLVGIFNIKSTTVEIPTSSLNLDQQFKQNMQQLKELAQRVRSQKIPLIIIFIPQLDNLVPTHNTPEYKPEFLNFCRETQVPVIDIHANWSNLSPATVKTYFRDNVHPNVPGNQAIANLLFEEICTARKLADCSNNSSQ